MTSALIISGPNAGGKTVALKTTGLLVAMAMSGLPLPAADGSMIPVVDAIHVLVGDDQSVTEHLSTFSAYLVRLKRVISAATEADRELATIDAISASARAGHDVTGAFADIGVMGLSPDAELAAARTAFGKGDLVAARSDAPSMVFFSRSAK